MPYDRVKSVVGDAIVWEMECPVDGVFYLVRDEENAFLDAPHFQRLYSPDGELCVVLSDAEFSNIYGGNSAVLDAVYGV